MITILAALAAAAVPAGTTFRCTPTRVWDGDGPLWCAEGPRIRLSGIAAREKDGTCRSNQPCPTASADAARDALVLLVGTPIGRSREGHVLVKGPMLTCRSLGNGKGARTAAWCTSPRAGDLSCAMVASRTVLKWQRYWRGHRCDPVNGTRRTHQFRATSLEVAGPKGLSAVREFILLPVALVGGTMLLVVVTLALPVIAFALWTGERDGYLRLGGWHRDDEPER